MEEPVLFTPFDYFCAGKVLHNCGGHLKRPGREKHLSSKWFMGQGSGLWTHVSLSYKPWVKHTP